MNSSLPDLSQLEVWFLTGSQHLYGEAVLQQVAQHAQQIANSLDNARSIPVRVVFKPVLPGAEQISQVMLEANANDRCIGLIAWMHTFSPAKMWIDGLKKMQKPLLHLHTQFNREIPWSTIDMDYMNLNQSAHGDREFGFIVSRLRINRKVVVGFWESPTVQNEIGTWTRAAAARLDWSRGKIARFGDNMRDVAVTEGDKVAAQERFGFSVNGYGVGDLTACIDDASSDDVEKLCAEYEKQYNLASSLQTGGQQRKALLDAARIELGLRQFLNQGNFCGYTNTFEDLHGIRQLPGIATQRLMADGFGFGAEGDWKAAAMVRAAKVMANGLAGGTSFMEDYTYHLSEGKEQVLGAHMLETCPSIAAGRPSCEVHPLGIGGKDDPVRLVFDAASGPAINATLVDLGDRFRMILNEVEVVQPPAALPKLPVARAVWHPAPNFPTAAASWIYAGGSHHPVFSLALTTEHFEDLCEMLDIELVIIDNDTRLRSLKQTLRTSDHVWGR
ncbi:UNVERIFIED_CONTAM: hypothetical protein GTU68_049924 [Idotea baltica]|nr:hypothetical protein [Idotea baltica]